MQLVSAAATHRAFSPSQYNTDDLRAVLSVFADSTGGCFLDALWANPAQWDREDVDVCKDITPVQITSPLFLSSLKDLVAVLTQPEALPTHWAQLPRSEQICFARFRPGKGQLGAAGGFGGSLAALRMDLLCSQRKCTPGLILPHTCVHEELEPFSINGNKSLNQISFCSHPRSQIKTSWPHVLPYPNHIDV